MGKVFVDNGEGIVKKLSNHEYKSPIEVVNNFTEKGWKLIDMEITPVISAIARIYLFQKIIPKKED